MCRPVAITSTWIAISHTSSHYAPKTAPTTPSMWRSEFEVERDVYRKRMNVFTHAHSPVDGLMILQK